jgi:hypothetical protein
MRRSTSDACIDRTSSTPAACNLKRSVSLTSFHHIPSRSKPTFLCLHNRLYLALYGKRQAESVALHELKHGHILTDLDIDTPASSGLSIFSGAPASLAEIFRFNEKLNALFRFNAGKQIVVCTGSNSHSQAKIVFLLGCHLIMSCSVRDKQVRHLFRPVRTLLAKVEYDCALHDFWSALDIAKRRNWISFKETFDQSHYADNSIDMEEYLHYAR